MPSPRSATAVVALLAALVAAGCSNDEDPSPSASPRPSVPTVPAIETTPEPTLPLPELAATGLAEVTTDPTPAWASPRLRGDVDVALVGDLVRVGRNGSEQVVDLRTGETRWSLREGRYVDTAAQASLSDELTVLDVPSGPLLVGPFYANRCAFGCPVPTAYDNEHKGLVALDARTGEVVWGRGLVGSAHAAFLRPRDRDQELAVRPAGIGPQVVVANVGDRDVVLNGEVDRSLPAYSVGLDPSSGEQLWSSDDVVVDKVVDGMVVGHLNDEDDPSLIGLDPLTGAVVWRSTEPYSGLVSVSPRLTVLDDGSARGALFVDTATGKPTDQQPPEGAGRCAPWLSGDLDVACAWRDPVSGDERLLTVAGGVMSLSRESVTALPDAVIGGAVVIDSFGDAPSVVDAAGRVLLPSTGERVLVLGERYVVLGTQAELGGGIRDVRVLRRR